MRRCVNCSCVCALFLPTQIRRNLFKNVDDGVRSLAQTFEIPLCGPNDDDNSKQWRTESYLTALSLARARAHTQKWNKSEWNIRSVGVVLVQLVGTQPNFDFFLPIMPPSDCEIDVSFGITTARTCKCVTYGAPFGCIAMRAERRRGGRGEA